jgi:hypothetical protein
MALGSSAFLKSNRHADPGSVFPRFDVNVPMPAGNSRTSQAIEAMASLDVSDVLDDPDFNSAFTIIRATATVDNSGMNQITSTTSQAIGVIQPATQGDLDRLPDAARQTGSIKLYTRFRLNIDALGVQSDRILWDGSTYTVNTSNSWLYGAGYYESLAVLTTLS